MPTLNQLSVQFARVQPQQVDNITEDSPILKIIDFQPSTHPMHNVYRELNSVTGAGFVDLDSPLPGVGAKSIVKTVSLSSMGGEIAFGEDEAQMLGGRDRALAIQAPAVLKQSGSNAEYAILYNMIRAWALENGKKINAAGSANKNYCILAIKFIPGETGGLYSPNGFADGALLPFEWLNGGNLMKIKRTIGGDEKDINGYSGRFKNYFGFQIANSQSVCGIFNIDIAASKLPSATQIDDLLDNVRVNNSSTFLLMHPTVASALKDMKRNKISINIGQVNDPINLENWEGVPIVKSYNFLKASEANVTFS